MAQLLTNREYQVLRLMLRGMANKEIGVELCITVRTVEYHIANILGKQGAPTGPRRWWQRWSKVCWSRGVFAGIRGRKTPKTRGKPRSKLGFPLGTRG